MDTKGGMRGGMDWKMEIDIYTLLCIKQITNENLQYSSVLCGDLNGGKPKKGGIYVYI